MDPITISLPESLKTYVEAQVADGHYSSIDQYISKLIEQDQKRRAQDHLDQLLLEGLDSGDPIRTTDEWWEQERSRLLKKYQQQ